MIFSRGTLQCGQPFNCHLRLELVMYGSKPSMPRRRYMGTLQDCYTRSLTYSTSRKVWRRYCLPCGELICTVTIGTQSRPSSWLGKDLFTLTMRRLVRPMLDACIKSRSMVTIILSQKGIARCYLASGNVGLIRDAIKTRTLSNLAEPGKQCPWQATE